MFIQLWQREFRGAQRRWWRQPWVLPIALIGVLMMMDSSLLIGWVTVDLPLGLDSVIFAWPELLLAIWILWIVSEAIARDRRFEQIVPLVLTPINRAEIAWAKTFAPIIISVIVIALINSRPLVDADVTAFSALGFDPRVYPRDHFPAAMGGAALVHMLLVPLFLATLASRMACRIPKLNWAFSVSLLIAIGVLLGTRVMHHISPLLLPICAGVLVVYVLALMDSRLLAALLILGLWIAHMQMAGANAEGTRRGYGYWGNYNLSGLQRLIRPSGIRELVAYLGGPLVMAWILIVGHDRMFSFILVGLLGFAMSLEAQWHLDPDGIWGPRTTLPLVILLYLVWLSRWRRWARRRFWDQLCRLE